MKIEILNTVANVVAGGDALVTNRISKNTISQIYSLLPKVEDPLNIEDESNIDGDIQFLVDGWNYKFNYFEFVPYNSFGKRVDIPTRRPGMTTQRPLSLPLFSFVSLINYLESYTPVQETDDDDLFFQISASVKIYNENNTEIGKIYIPSLLPNNSTIPSVENETDTQVNFVITLDGVNDITNVRKNSRSTNDNMEEDDETSETTPWSISSHTNKEDGNELHASEWNALFKKIENKVNDIIDFCNSITKNSNGSTDNGKTTGPVIDIVNNPDKIRDPKDVVIPIPDTDFTYVDPFPGHDFSDEATPHTVDPNITWGVVDTTGINTTITDGKITLDTIKNPTTPYVDKTFSDGSDVIIGNVMNRVNNSTTSVVYEEDYSSDKFYVNGVETQADNQGHVVLDDSSYEYVLSGTLWGSVIIDRTEGTPDEDTKIIMNGVKIISETENFAIMYETPSNNTGYKDLDVILAPNTTNLLVCTNKQDRGNNQPAALYSMNNLKLHGTGYLGVYNAGGHGIRATEARILGPHIYIDVNHDGIHGKLIECMFSSIYVNRAHDIIGTGTYDNNGTTTGGKIIYQKINIKTSENGVDGWWFSTKGGWLQNLTGEPYYGYSQSSLCNSVENNYYTKWDGSSEEYKTDSTLDGSGQGTTYTINASRACIIDGEYATWSDYYDRSKFVSVRDKNNQDSSSCVLGFKMTGGSDKQTVEESDYASPEYGISSSENKIGELTTTEGTDYKDYNISTLFGSESTYLTYSDYNSAYESGNVGNIILRASKGSEGRSVHGMYDAKLLALNESGKEITGYTRNISIPYSFSETDAKMIFENDNNSVDRFVIRISPSINQPTVPEKIEGFTRDKSTANTIVEYTIENDEVVETPVDNASMKYLKIKGKSWNKLTIPADFSYSDGLGGTSSDITIFLDGVDLINGISYLPTNGTLKLIALPNTYNFIGSYGLNEDAIKSENNIKIEVKNDAYLYVTSDEDGIDADEIIISDSKGSLIVEDCGQRGIKGTSIVIGPNAKITSGDIILITNSTIAEEQGKTFSEMSGNVYVKDNCRKFNRLTVKMDKTSEDTIKNTGFCDIYARQGKKSTKGSFATHPSGLTGVLMVGSIAATKNTNGGNAEYTFQYNMQAEVDGGIGVNHYENMPNPTLEPYYAVGYNAVTKTTQVPYNN